MLPADCQTPLPYQEIPGIGNSSLPITTEANQLCNMSATSFPPCFEFPISDFGEPLISMILYVLVVIVVKLFLSEILSSM